MDVILLERIGHLGNLGDQVKVKSGYGRNYLIPQAKAVMATKENIAEFEQRRADLEKAEQALMTEAEKRAKELDGLALEIAAEVTEEGALYGSVGVSEIVNAAQAKGKHLERSEVRLPEGPIKQLGDYDIMVQMHADVSATLKVKVIAHTVEK